ncbi:uncharacterized protein LOC107364791 [Tetranychus urticae]|uniref:uncharacterized protein LOC107364791 n=1 Tax=Tetranychus urticae TaxID=32264 RepID=UPI00077B9F81|nr:uncharacterized protein LOC107364791 [Tetranychus urticae]
MLCNQVNRLICTPQIVTNFTSVRCIGSINKKRMFEGRPPRRGDSVLFDGPDFSFMDGRGQPPLTLGQRRRYLQDKHFAEQIVKYMKEFQLAKQLKPDEPVERESIRHQKGQVIP